MHPREILKTKTLQISSAEKSGKGAGVPQLSLRRQTSFYKAQAGLVVRPYRDKISVNHHISESVKDF